MDQYAKITHRPLFGRLNLVLSVHSSPHVQLLLILSQVKQKFCVQANVLLIVAICRFSPQTQEWLFEVEMIQINGIF